MSDMGERNLLLPKWKFIRNLANELVKNKTTMSAKELACVLNAMGYTSTYGDSYDPNGRGIYKVIISAYYRARGDGDTCHDYDAIAKAFTKPNGEYAWKHQ